MAKLTGVKTIDMQGGDITKVSYQGEEYTKVGERALSGDILRIKAEGALDVYKGEFYAVGDAGEYFDSIGDKRDANHSHVKQYYEVFRKSPVAVSPPFAEMITSKVSAVEGDVTSLQQRVSALEVAKVSTPTFNEGDRVKALRDGEFGDIEAGEYGEITRFLDSSEYTVRVVDGEGYIDYFRPQDLELAPEESPKPDVGDIVVITGNTNCSCNEIGDIGRVFEVMPHGANVNVPQNEATVGNFTRLCDMRPATPAEFVRYHESVKKAKQDEEKAEADEVFTKAGRKPNEYRKGDVVRVTRELGESITPVLGVIEDDYNPNYGVRISDDYLVVFLGDTEGEDGEMEIVCFAEDRKDAVTKGGR